LYPGTIENIKIVKDIGEGCGEAVNDVLTSMNNMPQKWNPGKQNNKLVKVLYTPVKFSWMIIQPLRKKLVSCHVRKKQSQTIRDS
jgi:hypothetical protein